MFWLLLLVIPTSRQNLKKSRIYLSKMCNTNIICLKWQVLWYSVYQHFQSFCSIQDYIYIDRYCKSCGMPVFLIKNIFNNVFYVARFHCTDHFLVCVLKNYCNINDWSIITLSLYKWEVTIKAPLNKSQVG